MRPFVLSFRDNQVLNLSDEAVAGDIEIKDVMRTMDNRHVVAIDMLQNYIGEEVHMGESNPKNIFSRETRGIYVYHSRAWQSRAEI